MAVMGNILDPGDRVQPRGLGVRFNERNESHWGDDLRALVWNTPGDRIYSPCDALVVWVGWLDGTDAARIPYHSGFAVWLYLGRFGGDDMYLLVTHCRSIKVRAGQNVKAGHFIATMGGSGWRDGPDWERFIDHAHVGIAQNTTKPWRVAKKAGEAGWIDPTAWFGSKGVNFNTSQPAGLNLAATTKEDALSADQYNQIMKRIDGLEDTLFDRLVNGLKWAYTDSGNSEDNKLLHRLERIEQDAAGARAAAESAAGSSASNSKVVAWVKHDGKDIQTRQSLADAETHQWSREAVELLRAIAVQLNAEVDAKDRIVSQAVAEARPSEG